MPILTTFKMQNVENSIDLKLRINCCFKTLGKDNCLALISCKYILSHTRYGGLGVVGGGELLNNSKKFVLNYIYLQGYGKSNQGDSLSTNALVSVRAGEPSLKTFVAVKMAATIQEMRIARTTFEMKKKIYTTCLGNL